MARVRPPEQASAAERGPRRRSPWGRAAAFVRWLFAREELPGAPAAPSGVVREPGPWAWLLAPERLPDPPASPAEGAPGSLRWLLSRERLEGPSDRGGTRA